MSAPATTTDPILVLCDALDAALAASPTGSLQVSHARVRRLEAALQKALVQRTDAVAAAGYGPRPLSRILGVSLGTASDVCRQARGEGRRKR